MKTIYSCLVLCFTLALVSCSSSEEDNMEPTPILLSAMEQEVFDAVNAYRKEIGKAQLILSEEANKEALKHTEYMIEQEELNHDNFNDRSANIILVERASSVSENVARYYISGQEVLEGWLSSSQGHKENLEGDYTHTGIGVKKDPEGRYYYTQIFFK